MTTKAPSADHLSFLDRLRGIAILLVLTTHALQPAFGRKGLEWAGWWRDFGQVPKSFLPMLPLTFGWIGVAMFFVVSGFCIHLSHRRSREAGFKVFFIRRFFRIYPPYLLALLFFALVFPATRFDGVAGNVWQGVTHLLLLHNFSQDWIVGINGSFWSIAPEFQLYVLYPVLMGVALKWGWKGALWLAALVEIPMRVAVGLSGSEHCTASVLPLFFWLSWGIGAKIADDWLEKRPIFLMSVPAWGFPAATLVSLFFKPLFVFGFLFAALATARWIAALLSAPAEPGVRPSLAGDVVRRIGVVSYSVYLINEPLLNVIPDVLRWAFPHVYFHPLKIYAIALGWCGAICLVAGLLYRWVELPSIAWGKRIAKRLARSGEPSLAATR